MSDDISRLSPAAEVDLSYSLSGRPRSPPRNEWWPRDYRTYLRCLVIGIRIVLFAVTITAFVPSKWFLAKCNWMDDSNIHHSCSINIGFFGYSISNPTTSICPPTFTNNVTNSSNVGTYSDSNCEKISSHCSQFYHVGVGVACVFTISLVFQVMPVVVRKCRDEVKLWVNISASLVFFIGLAVVGANFRDVYFPNRAGCEISSSSSSNETLDNAQFVGSVGIGGLALFTALWRERRVNEGVRFTQFG